MKTISLREYFSRLQNVLYLIIIGPLLLFGFLYLQSESGRSVPTLESESAFVYAIMLVFVADVAAANWLFSRSLRETRRNAGLETKLQPYASAAKLRFLMISSGFLILAAGFHLTGHPLYLVLFLISLVLMSFWWPTPTKVSKDLRLKKDDRELVMKQQDYVVGQVD